VFNADGDGDSDTTRIARLYAAYMKAGGETRTSTTLE
jgi:hypothetical protein